MDERATGPTPDTLPFRPRLGPIAAATGMAFALPFLAEQLALAVGHGWASADPAYDAAFLAYLYLQHAAQAAFALGAILVLKRLVPAADFGLRLASPRPVLAVTAVCLAVWAPFDLVAYLPNIVAHTPAPAGHPLTAASIAGWSFFEGVFVGPTEEVLFRGLVIGYLTAMAPGVVRLGRFQVSGAAVVAAVIFGLAHLPGSGGAPWWQTLFHVTYAAALGLVYGYWFVRSRSLLGPAIAHNATDLAATATAFIVGAVWR